MLKKQPADDLFEKSSMSFGEHLEELRTTFIKAFIWAGLGTLIGLYFAESIIKFLEQPLKGAIYDFQIERAKQLYKKANGTEPTPELAEWINEHGMIPETVYVDPFDFGDRLGVRLPEDLESQHLSSEVSGESQPSDQKAKAKQASEKAAGAESKRTQNEAENKKSESEQDIKSSVPKSETTMAAASFGNAWKGVNVEQINRLQPRLLWRPVRNKLVSLDSVEGFMIWLKAGIVAGLIISSPGILWHFWQFIAAGLYPHERKYVYWYMPLSLALFASGVCLAFFVVFRLVLGFLMKYTSSLDVEFTPRLTDYMSFVLFLPLGFGIAFQLPLVMLGLHRFGLVTVEFFQSQWRLAVLVIAFMSMLFTPAEIYSMVGLFIPLTGLYFFGIFLCKYMPRGAGIGSAGFDPS